MKKIATLGLLLILCGIIFQEKEKFLIIWDKISPWGTNHEVVLNKKNEYYRNYDFEFVQNTDNFSPYCKQDIYNIFYTIINSGNESFTFYCPKDYEECISDVKELANDQSKLSDINNYVHPFNSFEHIETEYDTTGRITVSITKTYNDSEIKAINEKVDSVASSIFNSNNTLEKNITLAHDYIINNSKYDTDRSDLDIVNYKSDIAYGPLLQGYGICGGYTDAMQLFLEKLGVKSYRVSSEKHIWNAVNLNDNWYNLDLTWDDPVVSDGSDALEYNFFLISTKKMLEIESTEHNFDQTVYYELKATE